MARGPTRTQIAAVDALLAARWPLIRAEFMAAVRRMRAGVDLSALVAAMERGDVGEALFLLRLRQGALSPMLESIRQTYVAGGGIGEIGQPGALAATFAFDGQNPRAQAWIASHAATLVQAAEADHIEAMRLALTDAMQGNRPLRSAALDITGRMNAMTGQRTGGIMGLTAQQTDWVINARADLHNLDARYFTRALRDRRFDAAVRAAIDAGRPIPQADIDRIVGRYKDRLLARRGEVIARNEAFTAQAAGRYEAMRQMLDRPDVETVTKKWQVGYPRKPRENHLILGGTRVERLDDPFQLGGGLTCQHPHDDSLPASERLNCRCSVVYRVRLRRD